VGFEDRPQGRKRISPKRYVGSARVGEKTRCGSHREGEAGGGGLHRLRCRGGGEIGGLGHIPGHGSYMALDRQGFCEEIGSIEDAAAELDVELVLSYAVDDPIEPHVDRFALLGANGLGSEADGAFVITPDDSRGLGITEGMKNLALVDTDLGVSKKSSIFGLGNSSADHRDARAVAENRPVVERGVGVAKVVVATRSRARVWAV
jgi:hypothetical protein